MHYRDDAGAAVARLAALEVELAERRSLDAALRRYRGALEEEMEQLEHALGWYRQGERMGWPAHDALAAASGASPPRMPPTAERLLLHAAARGKELALAPFRAPSSLRLVDGYGALAEFDRGLVMERMTEVETSLVQSDWRASRLRASVEELRARCAFLRRAVEEMALRYPDHPPPERPDASHALVLGLAASLGGLWVAAMLLALLAG